MTSFDNNLKNLHINPVFFILKAGDYRFFGDSVQDCINQFIVNRGYIDFDSFVISIDYEVDYHD